MWQAIYSYVKVYKAMKSCAKLYQTIPSCTKLCQAIPSHLKLNVFVLQTELWIPFFKWNMYYAFYYLWSRKNYRNTKCKGFLKNPVPSYTKPYQALPIYTKLDQALPNCTCPVMSWRVLSRPVLSYQVLLCLVMSCRVLIDFHFDIRCGKVSNVLSKFSPF